MLYSATNGLRNILSQSTKYISKVGYVGSINTFKGLTDITLQGLPSVPKLPIRFFSTSFNFGSDSGSKFSTNTSNTSNSSSSEKFPYYKIPTKIMDELNDLYNVPYIKEWREMMDEMEKRKFNTKRLKIIIGILATSVIFVSYDIIRSWTSKQVTHITTLSLEDPKLQKELAQLGENLVNQLVSSEKIQNDVAGLLQNVIFDLAKRDDVQNALSDLFANVFVSKVVKDAGGALSVDVVAQIIEDEEYKWLRDLAFDYLCQEITRVSTNGKVQQDIGILGRNALSSLIWGPVSTESKVDVTSDVIASDKTRLVE